VNILLLNLAKQLYLQAQSPGRVGPSVLGPISREKIHRFDHELIPMLEALVLTVTLKSSVAML